MRVFVRGGKSSGSGGGGSNKKPSVVVVGGAPATPPKETVTITETERVKVPGIDVQPGDKPGDAVRRSLGGGGERTTVSETPAVRVEPKTSQSGQSASAQREKALKEANLRARERYLSEVRSGTERKEARKRLDEELGKNRFNYQAERIKSGAIDKYETSQVVIKKDASGEIVVEEKKKPSVRVVGGGQAEDRKETVRIEETQAEKVGAISVREPREFGAKDVDWSYNSLAGLTKEGKISPFVYLEKKVTDLVNPLAEKVNKFIPEGKVKEVLNTQVELKGDIAAGLIFAPALVTSTAALPKFTKATPIKTGQVIRQEVVDESGNVFIVERLQTKPVTRAQDVIKPVRIADQQLSTGEVIVVRETPGQFANVQESRLQSTLFSPKQVQTSPARVDTSTVRNILIDQEGQIVNLPTGVSRRVGSRMGKFFNIQGKQVAVDVKDFNKLPVESQKYLQRVAEARTGVPVSLENTPMMLRKEDLISFGELTSKDILRASASTGRVKLYPYGQRRTIASVNARARPVLDTDAVTVYATETSARDISKSLAGRRNEIIRGESIVFKEPIVVQEESNILGQNLLKKVKTDKVLETTAKVRALAAKNLPIAKINLPKNIRPEGSLSPNIAEDLTPLVSRSAFFGKGTYERTEEVAAQRFDGRSSQVLRGEPQFRDNVDNKVLSTQKSGSLLSQDNLNKNAFRDSVISNQPTKEQLKEEQILKFAESIIQEQKVNQRLKEKLKLKTQPAPAQKPKNPPKIKKTMDLLGDSKGKSILGKLKEAYSVVTRKGGKEIELESGLPIGRATKRGVGELLGTLRASFKLKRAGYTTEEDISYDVPRFIERSQKSPDWFVQRKETRLGQRKERTDIQFFRRQNTKRIKWF